MDLLPVDGPSICPTLDATNWATPGSSSALSRHLHELQFTFGQGACLEAAHGNTPVLFGDLDDPADTRWPAFTGAVLDVDAIATLVRLRTCGFAAGLTAGQPAWQVVERRVSLTSPHWLDLGTAGPAW